MTVYRCQICYCQGKAHERDCDKHAFKRFLRQLDRLIELLSREDK